MDQRVPCTGGHPNSGRVWRVKGTRWSIYTDGFEYCERGLVVDQFSLSEDPHPRRDEPYTRLSKKDFFWLGEISPGMAKVKVMQILKSKSLPSTPTKDGCNITATGLCPLTSIPEALTIWRASLVFTNNSLRTLNLFATFKL